MKFSYPLNSKVFRTETDFRECLQAVKTRTATVEEITLLIDSNIKTLYNNIISHFYGSGEPNMEDIWKREAVLSYIEEYEPHYAHLFPILKNNGLIGVCGRGFTFDSPRFTQTEEECNKIIELTFYRYISA